MEFSQQKQCMGIAYFVPVATRERPVSEGGARENPSPSPQQRSGGTLPPYPTKPNLQPPHMHACHAASEDSEHTNTVEVTEIASGLPTVQKSNKERCAEKRRRAQVASSEHGLLHKSTQETLRQKYGRHTCAHPLELWKPLKVHDGLKPDERHTAIKACPTLAGCSYRRRPVSH